MMYGNRFFGHNGGFGGEFYGGMHFMMMGVVLLVLIAIAITIIVCIKKKHSVPADTVSINILKENFAKGLISEEEYLSRKNVLTRK